MGSKLVQKKRKILLSLEQENELKCIIINEFPTTYDIKYPLWIRKAVQELIFILFKIKVSFKYISKLAKKLNLVSRRPEKFEKHRDDIEIDDYTKHKYYEQVMYPALKDNAEIYFLDETTSKQYSNRVTGYSQKGTPAHVEHYASTVSHSVATTSIAMSLEGRMYFKLETESFRSEHFIDFLKDISKKSHNRKIFIVLDNSRIHTSRKVEQYIKKQRKLKLCFLPKYAPDINPVELFNNALKSNIALQPAMTAENLREYIFGFLYDISKNFDYIKSFFNGNKVLYTQYSQKIA